MGATKITQIQNNINGYAYLNDPDITTQSVIIANTYGPEDNTYVRGVTWGGVGMAVLWLSSMNENEYTILYRILSS